MNRRSLLKTGLTASSLSILAASSVPTKVIDAAVHFYDPTRPQGVPWPRTSNPNLYLPTYPDRYLAATAPYKVDGVIAIEASPWLEDNLWLLNVADKNPVIRAVVGHIQPGHPDFSSALKRFSKHPLFRGIRIGGGLVASVLAQPAMMADLKLLSELDLHLDILVNEPPFHPVAELATRLPELRIIIGHLPLDTPKDASARLNFVNGLAACGAHGQVFVKVSGIVRRIDNRVSTNASDYKPGLDRLWDIFGSDRVVYASNWPASDMTAPYPVVHKIALDYVLSRGPAETEKFFWRNSIAIYKWKAA